MSPFPDAEHEVGFVTPELAPFEFELKARPEDFVVEELEAYLPAGEGDHVFCRIEKRGLPTWRALAILADHLGRKPTEFGYAGQKDAQAVTRQWVSIEHADPELLRGFERGGVRCLEVARHRNKLKLGQLRGNRFRITLRGLAAGERERLESALFVLAERGLPNAFGAQRFGQRGDGARLGARLLRGELAEYLEGLFEQDPDRSVARARSILQRTRDARRAVREVPRRLRSLHESALQSALFNRVLARRLERGGLDTLRTGDVAWIHDKGAVFLVRGDEPDLEPRLRARELSPSGPLFGGRLLEAAGATREEEQAVLAAADLDAGHLSRLPGGRRPLRIFPGDLRLEPGSDPPALTFDLPRGAYATVLVSELRKRS